MRLIAFALGLSVALLTYTRTALASPILVADCSINALLCLEKPTTYASLDLIVAGNFYSSPSGIQSDSKSLSGSETVPISSTSTVTLTDSASGNIRVGPDGIHTSLTTSGDVYCNVTCPFSLDGQASSSGIYSDFLGTGNNVPVGTQLAVTYTLDATGNSIQTAQGSTDSSLYIYFSAEVNSQGNSPHTCSNPTVNNIVGNYTYTCTLLLPVTSLDVIDVGLQISAGSQSNIPESNTLDASNTAKLASAILVDANGNPLPTLQLYDASGYDYNNPIATAPSAVPEPSALLLFATGALGLAASLRRKF